MAKSSVHDENHDLGFRPSVSSVDHNDHIGRETPENSPLSGDSLAYFPSDSETSNFSETDYGYASEPLPYRWPASRPRANNIAGVSGLGVKQHQRNSLSGKLDDDDQDLLSSGMFAKCCSFRCLV